MGGWVGAHGTDAPHSDSTGGWVRGNVTNVLSEWAKYWIDCAGKVNSDQPGKNEILHVPENGV